MAERRQGMDEVNQRLTVLETIAKTELGEPGGKEGRLHTELSEMRQVVDRIDGTLRGNGAVGIGEKVRRLERNQKFIITGLGVAMTAAARVGFEWVRAKMTGGQL